MNECFVGYIILYDIAHVLNCSGPMSDINKNCEEFKQCFDGSYSV